MSKFEKLLEDVKNAKTIAVDVFKENTLNSTVLFSAGFSREFVSDKFRVEIFKDSSENHSGFENLNLLMTECKISIDDFLDWYLFNVYPAYKYITFGYSEFQ